MNLRIYLYKLTKEQVIPLERMAEKSAEFKALGSEVYIPNKQAQTEDA